ncbi:MAG: hypothetical protein AB8G05_28465, partial [Oligoflexales bacterium]
IVRLCLNSQKNTSQIFLTTKILLKKYAEPILTYFKIWLKAYLNQPCLTDAIKFSPKNYFAKCQHESKCSKEIVLDFGDISYIFPEIILHYIDDVKSIGVAWLPPIDFLLNLKYGNYYLNEEKLLQIADKNIHKIGYLVKHNEQILETHGGSFNIEQDKYRDVPLCKNANMSEQSQVDEETIETLKEIIEFVNSQSPDAFDSRKAISGIGAVEYQFLRRQVKPEQGNQKPFVVQSYFEANIFSDSTDKNCEPPYCFKYNQVIKNTLEAGFESREQAEKVYQARLNVNNKISAFLPSINLGSVMSLAQSSFFSVVPSLVGFAFPSNWFAFKESNKLLDAELASYRTLLANQVTTAESLYITIHNHFTNKDILIYYHELISQALDYIKKQEALLSRKVESEELGYMQNLLARVEKQLLQVDSLIDDLRPELASLFNFQGDWQKINIETLDLTIPQEIISTELENYLGSVIEKSSELAMMKSLEKAASISRKSKYFDFLDPDGGGLGFNFATKVTIAKSEQDQIGIRLEKMRNNLKIALIHALNAYNTAVDTYKNGEHQIDTLKSSASALSVHLLSFEALDLERIERYFENAIKADIQKNTSKHMFKQSLASLNRLKWNGDIYEDIEKLRLIANQPVW